MVAKVREDVITGRRDTIAAIATPTGAGGIGIVRISGVDACTILSQLLNRPGNSFPDRQLVHGVARDREGSRIDDVLAVIMRGPRSFTGEDVAEVHAHGGSLNMSRILRSVLAAGARSAEAGEFTRRAFENGKLDLTRAEAVLHVIEASSERAWRIAQAQLDGMLGLRISEFRERATALLAEVEACIDFPEEGEEYLASHEIAEKTRQLSGDLAALARTFSLGKALRQGVDIAIVGPVNAGKSSLFNRLAGIDRAIVDESPGTTRDFVEISAVWEGVPVTLIDTAGDRQASEDRVEQQGIEMGRKRAAAADLRIQVHSAESLDTAISVADTESTVHIVTKSDLVTRQQIDAVVPDGVLVTSAKDGTGIVALKQAILRRVCGKPADGDEGYVVTSERQRSLLEQAASGFLRAAQEIAEQRPIEVVAVEIREATENLAEIVGERVGEEVLDELFSRFCIGK